MANYKINSNKTFTNPYDFVPIKSEPSRKNIEEKLENKELFTGKITCKLTVETPLVIPDTTKKEETGISKHYKYPTFRVGKEQDIVIPGSSIRGMLRSVYETATNSCMVTMDGNQYITKRSDLGSFEPCVLKKEKDDAGQDSWHLYPADRIPVIVRDYKKIYIKGSKKFTVKYDEKSEERYLIGLHNTHLFYGNAVDIKINEQKHTKNNIVVWNCIADSIEEKNDQNKCLNGEEYYLYLGERFDNKHAESVFEIKKNEWDTKISNQEICKALERLESTLRMYRSERINRNLSETKGKHYGYPGYERARDNNVLPLWYKKDDDGPLYLSLAAIGRVAYYNTLKDISIKHTPCSRREKLCPACAVFGMVGKENEKSIGSFIRVTDAIGVGDIGILNEETLKELGSPRISYLPFYSTDGKSYDSENASIKGRKYYWHNPAVNSDPGIYSEQKKTERNGTYELIKKGSQFQFDVYYDSLTKEQLQLLLWTIMLPKENENDKILLHKLGHGKPLGLGSVKIEVQSHKKRCLTEGLVVTYDDFDGITGNAWALIHKDSKNDLKGLLTYDEAFTETEIKYPYIKWKEGKYTENQIASHRWFSEFKKSKKTLHKALHPYDFIGPREGTVKGYNNNKVKIEIDKEILWVHIAAFRQKNDEILVKERDVPVGARVEVTKIGENKKGFAKYKARVQTD